MRDPVQPARQGVSPPDRAPPFLTRTRKVAWKASSASCGSRKIARQTLRTIGPCRPRSASKAPASPWARNRSRSRAIGEPRDHPVGEQAIELSEGGAQCLDGHVSESSRTRAL